MARPREDSSEPASSMFSDALQAMVRQLLAENLEALRTEGELPGPGWEPPGLAEKIDERLKALLAEQEDRGLGQKARDEVKAIARDITCAIQVPSQPEIEAKITAAVEKATQDELGRDEAMRGALEGKIGEALKGIRVLGEEDVRNIVGESVDALVKDRDRRAQEILEATDAKIAEALGKAGTPKEEDVQRIVQEAVAKAMQDEAGRNETLRQSLEEQIDVTIKNLRVPGEEEIRKLAAEAVGQAMKEEAGRDEAMRQLLEEKMAEALRNFKVLGPDEVRAIANEALAGVRVPTSEEIAEIARREASASAAAVPAAAPPDTEAIAARSAEKALELLKAQGGAPAPGPTQEEVQTLVREESARTLTAAEEAVSKALGEFRETGREEMIAEVLERVGRMLDARGVATLDEVATRIQEEVQKAGSSAGGEERTRAIVNETLAEEAKELVRRIKADINTAVDEKIEAFSRSATLVGRIEEKIAAAQDQAGGKALENRLQEAFAAPGFRKAVEGILRDRAGALKTLAEDLAEPIAAISVKTTEKILAREAEGLVRQIKIELGKVRNDLKKTWDKASTLAQSEEMAQRIKAVVDPLLEAKASFHSPEFKAVVEEISAAAAAEASKESLQGFLGDLRERIGSSIDGKLEEFTESDKLKEAIKGVTEKKVEEFFLSDDVRQTLTGVIQQVAPGAAKGGGGGANPEEVRKIVSEELVRRTEEAFKDLVPRHVGKYLDEKLPPPEFFKELVTANQLHSEIDKRLKSSGSGGSKGWGAGPGDTGAFVNLVSKILNSDQLKEAMDDRFKVINNYIKNELVPKAVKKMLEEMGKA